MSKSFTKVFGLLTASILLLCLTSCATTNNFKPTHKARTSICLIKSESSVPGSANRQLASSMVEAQVVFGVRARIVEIAPSEAVATRLLKALQSGCVLMVSAQREYLQQLAIFARGHSRMMVLFIGSDIAQVDQPGNFRWVSDDLSSAAKMAGFFMAEEALPITIISQNGYQNSSAIISAVKEGVAEFRRQSGISFEVSTVRFASRAQLQKNLQAQVQPSTVLLLAASGYWTEAAGYPDITFVGADLQFGQTTKKLPGNVVASIERGSGNQLLKAVSALLARDFANSPPLRRDKPLRDGLVELRSTTGFSPELENYRSNLLATE